MAVFDFWWLRPSLEKCEGRRLDAEWSTWSSGKEFVNSFVFSRRLFIQVDEIVGVLFAGQTSLDTAVRDRSNEFGRERVSIFML